MLQFVTHFRLFCLVRVFEVGVVNSFYFIFYRALFSGKVPDLSSWLCYVPTSHERWRMLRWWWRLWRCLLSEPSLCVGPINGFQWSHFAIVQRWLGCLFVWLVGWMAAWSFLFSYTMRVSLPKKYCSFVGRLVGWLVGWIGCLFVCSQNFDCSWFGIVKRNIL